MAVYLEAAMVDGLFHIIVHNASVYEVKPCSGKFGLLSATVKPMARNPLAGTK